MKRNYIFRFAGLSILFVTLAVNAQHEGELYLGLSPEITIEKEYDPGEFDFNALPLVLQYWLSDPLAIRITTTMNTHVLDGMSLSQAGGQLLLPWYFLHKLETGLSGFYLAPLAGFSYNLLTNSEEVSLGIEPGYTWFSPSGFSIFLGFQAGATWFGSEDETAGWRSHGGVKFSLGFRF